MARKKGIVKQISNYGEKHPYVTLALAGTFGYYFYENMVKPRMSNEGPNMMMNPAGIGHLSEHQSSELKKITGELNKASKMHKSQADRIDALGMTTSTSTTTSSSHIPSMRGEGAGETSMHIPHGSGLFGLGRTIKPDTPTDRFLHEQTITKSVAGRSNPAAHLMDRRVERNPPAHLMHDEVQRGGKELPGMMGLGSHCNGLGSHCTARGNPHCHCGGGMRGFSPSARRRVGHANKSSGLGYSPTFDTQFSNQEAMVMGDLKKHEDILGFSGMMPLQGGDWHE
jgi:hypothetical protein